MAFDFAKTISLIKGGLLDHEATWNSYLGENNDWQYTAMVLTGPVLIANVILSAVFSRMIGGYNYVGYHASFITGLFWGVVMAVVGLFVTVLVFNFLADTFNGNKNFSRAFAAVSLAAIPSWIGGILGALVPVIGILITLAGFIMSLVFMYKIMPLALGVPEHKRVVHFIVSLVTIIVINIVIGSIIGIGTMGNIG